MFSKYTHVHVIYHVPCYIYHIICRMKIDRILNILCYMLLKTCDMVLISCYKYPIKIYITCYDKFSILCDSHKIFLFVNNISHTADLYLSLIYLQTHTYRHAHTQILACMCAHTQLIWTCHCFDWPVGMHLPVQDASLRNITRMQRWEEDCKIWDDPRSIM